MPRPLRAVPAWVCRSVRCKRPLAPTTSAPPPTGSARVSLLARTCCRFGSILVRPTRRTATSGCSCVDATCQTRSKSGTKTSRLPAQAWSSHWRSGSPQSARCGQKGCGGQCGDEWHDVSVGANVPRVPGRLVVITGLRAAAKLSRQSNWPPRCPRAACVRTLDDDVGIDLWNESIRASIEAFQLSLSLDLLRAGVNVVIEWGTWIRAERDSLRDAARSIGSPVKLR